MQTSAFTFISRVGLAGCLALIFPGCVDFQTSSSQPSSYPSVNSSGPPSSVSVAPSASAPSFPDVVESPTPPPPPNRIVFFSEPDFRGESFVVETGAAMENLARLPRRRGSWNDGIASFRIDGIATVVAYADANFRGPRFESSSSLRDLVTERRAGHPDANWDRTISSLRVIPPRGHAYDPEPGYDRRTAENIVQRAYRDVLGREPDADGLRSYREKLTGGYWTEDEVRDHLRRSPEFRSINPDDVITKAYREVLKREPDPEGLSHYRELLTKRGWTVTQLRADLLRSEERSAKKINEMITRAYRDILGREPDAGGFATYERALREKGWSEQQLRRDLSQSAEARQRQGK